MNLAHQFQRLGSKQLAIQEGVQLLRQLQNELASVRATADAWGTTAIIANVTIIPLNIIVNAFELKAANGLYQSLVRQLYGKVGKSGTRIDGSWKTALGLLKQVALEELKKKGMSQFVPGVNILVGLSEDSLAAWQAIQLVQTGNQEIHTQAQSIERKIAAAIGQVLEIGVRRAEILERMQVIQRTA
ncbi:MAG: hypothetical protein HY854_06075 [Burkholderiales bacterium]|nr:hypothetical protein [Burkholderiales bacterium]